MRSVLPFLLLGSCAALCGGFIWNLLFWRRTWKQPLRTEIYELRNSARSFFGVLVGYVGLIGINISSAMLGGGLALPVVSSAAITAAAYVIWQKRQRSLAEAQRLEDEQVARYRVPDHVPDDL